jgi:hypothetical protein
MSTSRLEELVTELPHLVPLHEAVMRAINLMQDQRSSAMQVAKVIESDTALTAKILQFANSAWYFLPRRTTSVERALARIATRRRGRILFSAAAWRVFDRSNILKGFSPRRLWRHSGSPVTARGCRHAHKVWTPNEAYNRRLVARPGHSGHRPVRAGRDGLGDHRDAGWQAAYSGRRDLLASIMRKSCPAIGDMGLN